MTSVVYESAFRSGSTPAPGYPAVPVACPCQPEYSSTVNLEKAACSDSCRTHPARKTASAPADSVAFLQTVAAWLPASAKPQ